jgi:hypothetical protein
VAAALLAGDLDDAAVGSEVAAQDHEPAGRLQRVVERAHDLLALGLGRGVRLIADRRSPNGDRVAVQEAGLVEALREQPHSPGLVEVLGDEAAAGLEVAEQRHALGDAVEVGYRELDPGFARDREQMEDAVR